jgi:hypothetical protein
MSRLGLYSGWVVEPGISGSKIRPTLATLFIHTLLNLIFKNGFIFLAHPFKARLFFRISGFYPLPKFFTVEDMYKFYRLHRVKARIFRTYKTTFILRKTFDKFILSSVRLFTLGSWSLIVGTSFVPAPYKSHPSRESLTSVQPTAYNFNIVARKSSILTLRTTVRFFEHILSSFFLRNY